MKHKAKHGALTDDRTLHRAEHEEDKAARKQPPLLARDGGWERSELRSAARCPHSHSAVMTHSDLSGRSHWLATWNKHGLGARRALIGCRSRPSIQTETRRRAAKCGSGGWSRTMSTFLFLLEPPWCDGAAFLQQNHPMSRFHPKEGHSDRCCCFSYTTSTCSNTPPSHLTEKWWILAQRETWQSLG